MNKKLEAILNKYGTEFVLARVMEQLKLLATTNDIDVIKAVHDLLDDSGCDLEYILNLCECGNMATYVSANTKLTYEPWIYEDIKDEI